MSAASTSISSSSLRAFPFPLRSGDWMVIPLAITVIGMGLVSVGIGLDVIDKVFWHLDRWTPGSGDKVKVLATEGRV